MFKSLVNDYIARNDWRVKENSNQHYSLQGLNTHITAKAIAEYWLSNIYPESISNAHRGGRIHLHDLSTFGPYCVGWDLVDLLRVGFTGVPEKLSTAPAKHFRVALQHVVNFMYTLQGEAAGAVAFSNFDILLAPFIYYDDLSDREVEQCMQEFVYGMNVPTRTGFQSPFTNITMDLKVPARLKDLPVIIGGKEKDKTYGEFQDEVDLLNRSFARVMLEGDASEKPFSFPIPTYNITEDFDWENPVLDPIWKMTTKYGIPYFANFVNSDMGADDARSMCCRLRLDKRQLEYRGGGLFGSNPMTGSIGVVTINMPRIGYLAEDDQEFMRMVDETMDIAKQSLIIKRRVIEEYTDHGLYPYTRFYLRDIKDKTGRYWANHFSTIGLIGMHEACLNYLGEGIESNKGQKFALKMLEHMRGRISEYQEDTGRMFNLEATPAEGTSYRLAKIDTKAHPGIITQGNHESSYPYYTNSTHLPVDATSDLFMALKHQEGLQSQYTGGTVFHAFLGEAFIDWKALRSLVRKVAHNFKMPYYTITPTFSTCPNCCAYISGSHYTCPLCGAKTEVYSRIVGYLRPVGTWNDGKVSEFEDRQTYNQRG